MPTAVKAPPIKVKLNAIDEQNLRLILRTEPDEAGKLPDLPQKLLVLYASAQRFCHRLSNGPLPFDLLITLCLMAGCRAEPPEVKAPEPTEE